MKRQFFSKALTFAVFASAVVLSGCATVESRISEHPEIFNRLSPNDRALVQQGRIRVGMREDAVWLAWGSPDRKMAGAMRGGQTETWNYMDYASDPYPYRYPYYGPGFGYGFHGVGVVRRRGHRSFVYFGDPFYDPFYYSYIPPRIAQPYKTVTFLNGRVVSFQYLVPPYR